MSPTEGQLACKYLETKTCGLTTFYLHISIFFPMLRASDPPQKTAPEPLWVEPIDFAYFSNHKFPLHSNTLDCTSYTTEAERTNRSRMSVDVKIR